MLLPDNFSCTVAVVGLGYVGLPLAIEITKNRIFLKHKPNITFIKQLAYTLQNVLKKTKNSYVHGFIIYS